MDIAHDLMNVGPGQAEIAQLVVGHRTQLDFSPRQAVALDYAADHAAHDPKWRVPWAVMSLCVAHLLF